MRHLSAWSYIFIHALRVEGDIYFRLPLEARRLIFIHALRVEGDNGQCHWRTHPLDFYPRPPGGGRPPRRLRQREPIPDFYPRPPGGGRRLVNILVV